MNYTDIITVTSEMFSTTVLPDLMSTDFFTTSDFSSMSDFASMDIESTTDFVSTPPPETGIREWLLDLVVKNAAVKGGFWQGFLASLSVVIVSELADKTFFIAAIMAMKHSRIIVFSGAISALIFMTVLSAAFGWVATVVPRVYTHYISAALFLIFGLKMLRDGWKMDPNEGQEELDEVQTELKRREEQGSPSPSKTEDSSGRPESPQLSRVDSQASLNPRTPEARKTSRPKSLMISDSPKSSERQVRFSPEIIKSDVTYQIPNGKSPQSIEQTVNDSITDQESSQSNARRRLSIKDRKESISPERDSGIGLKSPQNAKTEYISPEGESHTGEKTPEVNVSSQKTLEVTGQKSEVPSQVSPEDPQAGPSNRPEMREDKEETAEMLEQGLAERRKRRSAVFKVLLQAATLTFLAEWGDRSQLATVVLATREDVFGVVVGGSLGHALCTGLAVIGGRMVAQKISVRTVTIIGGIVFLFFAVSALIMGPGE
ncbi:unnamed protein product [Pieris macdunnoughi]|uniref:GDT1 family protein n=1 Tax=Pieris macdunnoughi TaxID=345717 RepID=A0A821TP33_9NEOP|nr:unnamed protein product [Pieris macdunnoughi]